MPGSDKCIDKSNVDEDRFGSGHDTASLDVMQRRRLGVIARFDALAEMIDQDWRRMLAAGVARRVATDATVMVRRHQRRNRKKLEVRERRERAVVDHRRAFGLDPDSDPGAAQ